MTAYEPNNARDLYLLFYLHTCLSRILNIFFLNFILITFPDDSIKNLGVGCGKSESDRVAGSIYAGVVPQGRDINHLLSEAGWLWIHLVALAKHHRSLGHGDSDFGFAFPGYLEASLHPLSPRARGLAGHLFMTLPEKIHVLSLASGMLISIEGRCLSCV